MTRSKVFVAAVMPALRGAPTEFWANIYCNTFSSVLTVICAIAAVVLAALIFVQVRKDNDDDAMLASLQNTSGTSETPPVSPSLGTYLYPICSTPFQRLDLVRTWYLMGDSFARSGWTDLLDNLVKVRSSNQVRIIDLTVGNEGDVASQWATMTENTDYLREHSVVFLSFGIEWLYTQEQRLGDAPISLLLDQVEAVVSNHSFQGARLSYVILLHPDPVQDRLRVPKEQQCAPALRSLQYPTVRDLMFHDMAIKTLRQMAKWLCQAYSCAVVDPTEIQGLAPDPLDCYLLTDTGNSHLADAVYSCMQKAI